MQVKVFQRSLIAVVAFAFVFVPLRYVSGASLTQNNFYVKQDFDSSEREKVTSTRIHTSEKAYFYVDNAHYFGLTQKEQDELKSELADLGEEFDSRIYPELRNAYGEEWSPGIDNDERVTVFFTDMKEDVNGYVLKRNEKPRDEKPKSNKREMLYLNTRTLSSNHLKSHLAHEFVHIIEYNQRDRLRDISERRWLSEALAEYAPTILGYNTEYEGSYLQERADDFLSSPHNSLTDWKGEARDFASSSLFMHYVAGQYGGEILGEIMRSNSKGARGVEKALQGIGTDKSFGKIFSEWAVANFVNGSTQNNPDLYKYKNENLSFSNLHISSPTQYTVFPGRDIKTSLFSEQGSASWLRFTPGNLTENGAQNLNVDFSSSPKDTNFTLPYVVTKIDGTSRVSFAELSLGDGTFSVPDFGSNAVSVALIPANFDKVLSINNEFGSYSINVSLEADDVGEVKGALDYPDGSLLRAKGGSKVYVIKKPSGNDTVYKRWIPTEEIFNGYGHFRWEDIIEVEQSTLDELETSRLIKFADDPRVFEVAADGATKRWLDMTAEEFTVSGRSWGGVFEVNKNEFDSYNVGSSIAL